MINEFEQLLAETITNGAKLCPIKTFAGYYNKGLKELYLTSIKPEGIEKVTANLDDLYSGENIPYDSLGIGEYLSAFTGEKYPTAEFLVKREILWICFELFLEKYPEYKPKTNEQ